MYAPIPYLAAPASLRRFRLCTGIAAVVSLLLVSSAGQGLAATSSIAALKRMSLEELMQQQVLLVSRTAEPVGQSASAIQAIPAEVIRRSGSTRLPEALRLATNLAVSQVDSSRWAVSARGFNSILANKLLVMIDGRTVYSPLFAGVFWDSQDVMLEDVDRIEVVSGPGGALWGANAVNGVIDVRTKSARDTQGLLVTAGGGSGLERLGSVRYGGALSPNAHYRVYGKFAGREGNLRASGTEGDDDWRQSQAGFRVDWDFAGLNQLTLSGDLYEMDLPYGAGDATSRGGNLNGRWSRSLSPSSGVQLEFYYDRAQRNQPGEYNDRLDTYDLDFQHRFTLGRRHAIVWGAGYRRMEDDFQSGRIIILPQRQTLETLNAFVQDSIILVPDRLQLTVGGKAERNRYTGSEAQPSVRLAWRPSGRQTYWAAVSRAVRTPSRLDRDRFFPRQIAGSPNFDSEVLVAWEMGARLQPHDRISLTLAPFFHDYEGIRSVEFAGPGATLPLELGNGQMAESYGVELTAHYEVNESWRLHAGLTELRVNIEPEPESRDRSFGALESVDSERYASLRTSWQISADWDAWANLRYASAITNRFAGVPAYLELDARIGWSPSPRWEISVTGQNLLNAHHAEYGDPTMRHQVERRIFGMLQWSF